MTQQVTNRQRKYQSYLTWGTDTAYTVTAAWFTYADDFEIVIEPDQNNAAWPVTINVNGLWAVTIKRNDGTDLQADDLVANVPVKLYYDQSQNLFFLLVSNTVSGWGWIPWGSNLFPTVTDIFMVRWVPFANGFFSSTDGWREVRHACIEEWGTIYFASVVWEINDQIAQATIDVSRYDTVADTYWQERRWVRYSVSPADAGNDFNEIYYDTTTDTFYFSYYGVDSPSDWYKSYVSFDTATKTFGDISFRTNTTGYYQMSTANTTDTWTGDYFDTQNNDQYEPAALIWPQGSQPATPGSPAWNSVVFGGNTYESASLEMRVSEAGSNSWPCALLIALKS